MSLLNKKWSVTGKIYKRRLKSKGLVSGETVCVSFLVYDNTSLEGHLYTTRSF